MPPRRGAKRGSAKKPTSTPKVEEPQVVVEEEETVTPSSAVVEVPETKAVEETGSNQESFIVKEDVSVTTTTTVVVEERKFETEGSGFAQEEKRSDSPVTQEALEEEKKSAEQDVVMDGNGDAPVVKEAENDNEGEEEEEEEGEEESEPEEDGIQNVVEGEETAVEATVGGSDGDNEGEESESGTDEDDEEDVELSSYMQLRDKKKQSGVEIFIGGLNRKAVEEDLTKVFGEFGELKSVRIVKHPVTKRSKGYAFISYATVEQAQKVLTDLKDGIEVMGKRAGVSASQDSDTLYMGNICKSWTKEKVLETLKGFGIEQIDEIYLPEDPKSEGQIRGFAYLEFGTHSDAMAAFQRLRKPDAVFGRNRSAKVAFAPSMHPSAEALSQVKTIYVEGLTESWDEEKLKNLCEQYGQVDKVQLSRDLVSVKRKDFAFVSFTLRENAIACVGAINSADIGEGDIKIKANLAKPQYKGRLGKNARGGYKVQKDGEAVEETGKSKTKVVAKANKGKGKAVRKFQSPGGVKKPQGRQGTTAASKEKEQPPKGRKRAGRSTNFTPTERPSKKPRDNAPRSRPFNGSGNRGRSSHSGRGRQARNYNMAPSVYVDPYVRGYAASGSSYQGRSYGAVSDMEPHAGYLNTAPVNQGRDPYDYRLRRAGGYDTQRSGATSYAGGSMRPPSYAPDYSHYAAYESGSAGGYVYPSSGTYAPRRQYY